MADGHFRFQQGAGQYYYPQHTQQSHSARQTHLRTNSPPANARIGFSTDTPSPTRSPGRHSPPHTSYGMYGQGHQQGQNSLINGHQRFGMGVNMPKQYQGPTQHHTTHSGHHPQQEHNTHNGHGANYTNHQHNSSNSGFGNTTPQFQSSHLRNGTPTSGQNGMTKPPNEQWAQQLQLAAMSREATMAHPHARNNPSAAKSLSATSVDLARRENERAERNRIVATFDDERQEWVSLDCGGQGLRALAPQLFEYRFLDKLYLNNNKLTYLPESIGLLRGLSHLDLSLNHLMDLPAEIGMLLNLKTLLLFDNNLETLPNEMGSLYQLEILGIEGNPLNDLYKHIMVEQGTREMITYLRERAEEPEPPTDREWLILDETESTRTADKLTVMSYNTLCDKAATQTAYGYTPMNALAWDHRKVVILDELRARNADVICMQEVDMENFHEYFRPALAHDGYKGIYFPRPKARTMADREAKQVDGCATFFKDNKFILLDKQIIDFVNTAINRPDMKDQHDIFNRVMPRDNIGVATFLENRASGDRVIIVNSHLAWDPYYKDVKVVQAAILMEKLAQLAAGWVKTPPCKDKKLFRFTDGDSETEKEPTEPLPEPLPSQAYAHGDDIPLILCTDLNSTSDSGVCQLISQGSLPPNHPDLGDYKYGNFTRDGMTHPFKVRSSYAQIGELSFTNYTAGFSGVIDYIWYSTKAFQVTGLLGEVDKDYLQRVPGFPNYHFPSDHLALMAEFVLKNGPGTGAVSSGTGAGAGNASSGRR